MIGLFTKKEERAFLVSQYNFIIVRVFPRASGFIFHIIYNLLIHGLMRLFLHHNKSMGLSTVSDSLFVNIIKTLFNIN